MQPNYNPLTSGNPSNQSPQGYRSSSQPTGARQEVATPLRPAQASGHQQSAPSQGRSEKEQGKDATHPFFEISVYGNKCGAQFKTDVTQGDWHTLRLEGAMRKNPGNNQDRTLNWKETKIALQLTSQELPVLIGVLNGWLPTCEFKNHGAQNNKGFKISHQPERKGYFFELFQANMNKVAVQIPYVDAMHIGHTALNQYLRNFPNITSDTVLRSIHQLITRLYSTHQ